MRIRESLRDLSDKKAGTGRCQVPRRVQGRKNNSSKLMVKIPNKEFVKEHKRLPRVLTEGGSMVRRKEAKEQKQELKEFEKKQKGKKK